uniref:Putative regucalcin n=1 Tax=Rhodnius prolixus TaxID=13249 RepID=R4G7Y2_RHOPR
MYSIEQVSIGPLGHGASPFWDNKTCALYVSDLQTGNIFKHDTVTKENLQISLEKLPVAFVIPIFGQPNSFICGEGNCIKKFDWDFQSNTANNVNILECLSESDNQFIFGKCDACGRLWAGTASSINFQSTDGCIHSFSNRTGLVKQASEIYISSGIAWNLQNNKMFHSDPIQNSIEVFNYDVTSGLLKHNVRGHPNGMTTDENGNLWIACYEGSQVININPETGVMLSTIQFPTNQLTYIAFGGRFLNELYVTSAGYYFTNFDKQRYNDAGSIYRVKNLHTKGLNMNEYLFY